MTERIHNFSAGPAVLPVPVLEEAQRDMLSLPGVGMSVMEISHRSKTFDEIFSRAESGLRELLGVPDNYHVLFLQGGASLQFSMVPMNLLPRDGSADYVITGSWGKKALKEAKRSGQPMLRQRWQMADSHACRDRMSSSSIRKRHTFTSQQMKLSKAWNGNKSRKWEMFRWWPTLRQTFFRITIPVEKYALIYAGAQKNMGPSGVTLVIIRDDLLSAYP